ncbi:TRAP transporter large permease subunit [Marivibrio halodurans]|uniref:TRAP transporter large permease subunit n=1 Tax=Marivibrio halodurans TaxID=2039722 RepID=A0A8J7SL38_9PROT|nr:TRAP transporter large permease subunit [Marivibrio halodurans]MBP5855936.1 TRAP transporter large permease subunit [Marivibrio halodurans]
MELLFLAILVIIMASALASGFPVAFSLPGSAIVTVLLAAGTGYLFEGNPAAYFAEGGPSNWLSAGVTNFRGIYWEVERDTLIAIPLFVFMGIMLQRSKIAEDLLISMAQLFGPVRGGLGISVVFVGALLAATTGIVGATVVAMGLISLPAMIRNKYANWLSTGTIAASGTLGQIIPPSIVLIILADQLASAVDQAGAVRTQMYKDITGEFSMPSEFGIVSTSAGDMFMGAMVPGLVLVAIYMVFILAIAFVNRKAAPPVPKEGGFDRQFWSRVAIALVPPLTLIFVVLGSIIAGIATVNQAGAIGAVGATVMAGYRLYDGRKGAFYPAILAVVSAGVILTITAVHMVNVKSIQTSVDVLALVAATIAVIVFLFAVAWSFWRTLKVDDTLRGVLIETAKTTSLVFIILLGAAMLTAAFRAFGGEELVREFLQGLPGGFWTQFIIVMAVIFVLGFFLDFIEIAVVVVPIVAPILLADPGANITAVWLGVMIGLNIQTSFLTPPFGFALFYLRGVASKAVKTVEMYKGVVPFIALQLLALVIVGSYPALVNYLPTRISLLSETAPPPKNPRLQACIEDYVSMRFSRDGDEIRAAIASAEGWDLTLLPEDLAGDVAEAINLAGQSFSAMEEARAESAHIEEAKIDYQPLRDEVRRLQSIASRDAELIEETGQELDNVKRYSPDQTQRIAELEEELESLKADREAMLANIPPRWDEARADMKKLLAQEKRAYLNYRRTVDNAYEPIGVLKRTLRDGDALAAMREDVAALSQPVEAGDFASAEEDIGDVLAAVRELEGTNDLATLLSDMRRAIRESGSSAPDPEEALSLHGEAMTMLEDEIAWRSQAAEQLLPKVIAYDEAVRDTIGLRLLERLPRRVALYVADCNSVHRDISVNF